MSDGGGRIRGRQCGGGGRQQWGGIGSVLGYSFLGSVEGIGGGRRADRDGADLEDGGDGDPAAVGGSGRMECMWAGNSGSNRR